MYYRKLCRRRNFPNSPQRKQNWKKKKKNCIKNSAELVKSKRYFSRMDDIYVLHFLWFKQALSFLHGVCISQPSVSSSVNRYKF